MVRKNIDQAAVNLESSISLIPERFEMGVKDANWKTAAESAQAEANYAAGTQKAIANKSRQKAISKVSNEEWKNKTITLGKARIGEGIRANLQKYKDKFAPVLTAMNAAAASAPPRTVDPMANIDNRLKKVVAAAIAASPKNK